jgi:hypothetical protein
MVAINYMNELYVKKFDKVEDIGVPFLYISLQFILPETFNI